MPPHWHNLTSSSCLQVSLGCEPPELLINDNNEPLGMSRHVCSIGNPFSGPGSIRLRVALNPVTGIVGNENDVSINFTVGSINPEMQSTLVDNSNFAIASMSVEARADVSIDDGYASSSLSLSLALSLSLSSSLSLSL